MAVSGPAPTPRPQRARLVTGINDGSYIELSPLTVGEWIRGEWLALIQGRVKSTTAASYMANLNNHVVPALASRRLQPLAAADLNALYADLLQHGRVDGKGDYIRGRCAMCTSSFTWCSQTPAMSAC